MRILHVIPYISPVFGGPPQVIKAMMEVSAESGHEVITLTTTAGISEYINCDNNLFFNTNKNYRLFNTSFPNQWFHSKSLIKELDIFHNKIDLVHLHIPFTSPFFFAAKWALKNNIPYVISTHGILDSWSMNQKKIKKMIYYFLIEKNTLKKALKIHVTSLLEKNEVERLGLGLTLEIISPPVSNNDKLLNLKNYNKNFVNTTNFFPRILFIGRLHPVKGIPFLLKSMETLHRRGIKIFLDLAGIGEPSYEELLKHLIYKYGLNSYVVLHRYANEIQKKNLYKSAFAFVFPSLHENFGLAAAEAMLAGLPVIVTDQVGLAADITKFNSGIVVPACDSDSIANAIEKLFKLDRTEMSNAAMHLVKSKYNFEEFSLQLNNFYIK